MSPHQDDCFCCRATNAARCLHTLWDHVQCSVGSAQCATFVTLAVVSSVCCTAIYVVYVKCLNMLERSSLTSLDLSTNLTSSGQVFGPYFCRCPARSWYRTCALSCFSCVWIYYAITAGLPLIFQLRGRLLRAFHLCIQVSGPLLLVPCCLCLLC